MSPDFVLAEVRRISAGGTPRRVRGPIKCARDFGWAANPYIKKLLGEAPPEDKAPSKS
jgi:hypothetical protein